MFAHTPVLLQIVFRTTIIYLVILLGVRLSGKREVGQMTPFDLVLLLLISNSVQNAMTGGDNSVLGGIVAAAVLFALNYLVAEWSGLDSRFRAFVQGSPTMLVSEGNIIPSHLAKEHVSFDELDRALREHGVANVQDVAVAILEVDGSISVLRRDDIKPDRVPKAKGKVYLRKH